MGRLRPNPGVWRKARSNQDSEDAHSLEELAPDSPSKTNNTGLANCSGQWDPPRDPIAVQVKKSLKKPQGLSRKRREASGEELEENHPLYPATRS